MRDRGFDRYPPSQHILYRALWLNTGKHMNVGQAHVRIDEQHAQFAAGQSDGQVQCGRGLSHPALAAGDCHNPKAGLRGARIPVRGIGAGPLQSVSGSRGHADPINYMRRSLHSWIDPFREKKTPDGKR